MTAAFEDPVWDLGLPTEAEALLSDPPASRLERLRRFDPQAAPELASALRTLMAALEAPAFCGKKSCARVRRCVSEKIDCFWLNLPEMRAVIRALERPTRARGDGDAPISPPKAALSGSRARC